MSSNKYQFNIYTNTPETSVKVDIPNYLQGQECKFIVSSLVIKMKTSSSAVFLHSFALRSSEIVYLPSGANSLIATTVASATVSNPINTYFNVNDIGFIFPSGLAFGGDVDISLKDELGNLLTDIDFAVVTIDVAKAE